MADRERWNDDPGRGQSFGREYDQRGDWNAPTARRAGPVYGGPAAQRFRSARREGDFGRDLGRRGMEAQGSFAGSRGVGESMFGPGGLGPGGFGTDSFGFGRRGEENPSFGAESQRGRGPKGYRRSDERIREDIAVCLTEDDRLDASDIEIEVRDCEVELNGTIRSRDDKRRAEDLAAEVSGVRHVQNNLRVEQAGGVGYSTAPAGMGRG